MTPWSPVRNHPLMNASALALGLFAYPRMTWGPRTTISPVAPAATGSPRSSTTLISGPAAGPTVPGFRARGGSGLLDIWCAASVIPYDSITGARKTASSSPITLIGSADEDERTKRSRLAFTTSWFLPARLSIAWCIVGTPVYQVGFTSPSQPKNLSALNPLLQHTSPPTDRGASSPVISPWIWKSGMMQRPRSSGVNWRVAPMCRAEAQMLRWARGTILGRDVVPDVWRTSAMSSGDGSAAVRAAQIGRAS